MLDIYQNFRFKNDCFVLIVTAVSTVANGLVPVVISILTGRVFNLLQSLGTDTYKTKSEFVHELTVRSFSIAAVAACVIPISWVSLSTWMTLGERQGFRIRNSLIMFYFEKDLKWYDSNENLEGDFIQINRCIEEVRASSAEASAIFFQNVISIIALIATSMYYSWSLTLIILCSLPLLATLAVFLSMKVEKFSKLENLESSKASSVLAWSLDAFQMIRLFNTSYWEQKKFETLVSKCNKHFVKSCLYSALNASSLRFLTLCMFVQGFWFGNTQIKRGKMKAGDVITCFSSCLLLGSSLSSTLQQIVTIQKGKAAIQRINQFLVPNSKSAVGEWEKRSSLISTSSSIGLAPIFCDGDIEFRDVSFAYPTRPDDYVLKNVSIKIKSGATCFIVGKSGSGKSTLASLLLKMYGEYTGEIKFGEYEIDSLDDSWLVENITLVEQRCTLFNGTLKDNLTIVNKYASCTEVKQACQFALLNTVLLNLPNGIDTLLGRHGVTLSGGQQQRVALARAYLRNTPVLILDESLSALDIMSRELIVEAIRHWRKGKTTIILTHEYTQIKDDEYVYLMSEGTVVESGFKYDLLENPDSYFAQLNSLQETRYEVPVSPDVELPYSPDSATYNHQPISRFSRFFFDASALEPHLPNTSKSTDQLDNKRVVSRVQPLDIEKALQERECDLEEQGIPKILTLSAIMKKMNNSIPKRRYLVLGLLFSVIAGMSNPLFSYTFSKLLTGIAPQDTGTSSSYYLMKWSLIVISISAVDGISTFLKDFILGYCSEVWIERLRVDAMAKISSKSLDWFKLPTNNSSELNSLMMNDLRDLRGLASEFLSAITTLVFVASIGLIWALVSGWKLSLVCISLFPAFILFSGIYGSLLQVYETAYKTEIAELETRVHELVISMKTIKLLQLQQHFEGSFKTQLAKVRIVCKKRSVAVGFGIAVTNALAMVVQAILFFFGIKLVIQGEYSVAQMFETFTLLLFSIMTCVSLINQVPEISRGQRAATYIFKVLEDSGSVDTSKPDPSQNQSFFSTAGNRETIKISNLSFAFSSAPMNKIFNSLSCEICLNETVGIVGESGSGKSTLSLLLTRLYPVPSGKVYIGGIDINKWDEYALRRTISIVEQKPKFFDGTVRENLVYGLKRNVSNSELRSVLKSVDLLSFVQTLPNDLNTRVHDGLMSGGQAQRLSIARTLLRQPKIIILDECTSALDAANSFAIAELIRTVLKNVTVIVITHSEQLMQICDRVLVLKKGKVKEEGSYAELFESRGELYRIVSCTRY
ncbi:ATP-binding cassette a-factor transporter STE6 [Kluyveromyces lactis]|uniref:KLLA0B14256p n=1 Tax=Kluyveromyces lactis (strain ATCC 8585 / CBS 2359 / DSM 70799 / NBRC 1267 / NRRL Y-1140 / WM37) TaxID=284590 RepID=Q6CV74_KLULA|nr:uncharacterized protein KLLA0_B14256g [Kluyveromyces lactis]CAH02558.1 KLLA0B14256p [Kluyveromyces lactis]|eukprot:XP_452165.1 uncharacterized protein KLLA0_B14256g [Kluyveromyces lactis]